MDGITIHVDGIVLLVIIILVAAFVIVAMVGEED
jgi:hypothetical protein